VNLAATVPGWTRFAAAEEMLHQIEAQQQEIQKADFQTFLSSRSRMPGSAAERDALFRDFLLWRENQSKVH
jgi:hypothetical protein